PCGRTLTGGPGGEQGQPPPAFPNRLHIAHPARTQGHSLEGGRRVGDAVTSHTSRSRPVILEAVHHDAIKIGTRRVRIEADFDDAVMSEHELAVRRTRAAGS